ncbi:unnamed protein product [Strongylus vulgaris]|uniref:Uncharacterized protein n=1 Tax=Strongylus vulgaris TaxID=40348 RepID=A0A3P7ITZ1_STRVU|nr:unnamed protein product [Strongylus vulgaris]
MRARCAKLLPVLVGVHRSVSGSVASFRGPKAAQTAPLLFSSSFESSPCSPNSRDICNETSPPLESLFHSLVLAESVLHKMGFFRLSRSPISFPSFSSLNIVSASVPREGNNVVCEMTARDTVVALVSNPLGNLYVKGTLGKLYHCRAVLVAVGLSSRKMVHSRGALSANLDNPRNGLDMIHAAAELVRHTAYWMVVPKILPFALLMKKIV